jgi:hypothetical protein
MRALYSVVSRSTSTSPTWEGIYGLVKRTSNDCDDERRKKVERHHYYFGLMIDQFYDVILS